MQVFDNGCFVTVTVTRREVSDFARSWPCSGLRDKPITFQFDKRNGDLVDTNDDRQQPDADNSAIAALSQDAKEYGWMRLKLNRPSCPWPMQMGEEGPIVDLN